MEVGREELQDTVDPGVYLHKTRSSLGTAHPGQLDQPVVRTHSCRMFRSINSSRHTVREREYTRPHPETDPTPCVYHLLKSRCLMMNPS